MSTPIFAPLFQYIEANLHKKINIEDAARTIFLSPVHATRLFSFAYGITPAEYIRKRKLSESLRLLQKTDKTVLEIALHFGFAHEQSFTRAFFAEFGLTPGKYRNTRPELPVLLPIPNFGKDITMNMAFEFDTFNEYISFVHSFEESKKNSPRQLTMELADCIIPDMSITKYKLLIDKNKFDLWLNNKLNQDNLSPDNINSDKKTSSLFITTDSPEKDLYRENLQRDFNFIYKDTEEDFEIKQNTYNYRINPVKKKRTKSCGKDTKIFQKIKTVFWDILSKLKQICRKNKKYLIFGLILFLIIITIIINFE